MWEVIRLQEPRKEVQLTFIKALRITDRLDKIYVFSCICCVPALFLFFSFHELYWKHPVCSSTIYSPTFQNNMSQQFDTPGLDWVTHSATFLKEHICFWKCQIGLEQNEISCQLIMICNTKSYAIQTFKSNLKCLNRNPNRKSKNTALAKTITHATFLLLQACSKTHHLFLSRAAQIVCQYLELMRVRESDHFVKSSPTQDS